MTITELASIYLYKSERKRKTHIKRWVNIKNEVIKKTAEKQCENGNSKHCF